MDTKRLHLTCLQYSQKTYISNTTSILLLCVFSRQRQSAEGFSAAPNCFKTSCIYIGTDSIHRTVALKFWAMLEFSPPLVCQSNQSIDRIHWLYWCIYVFVWGCYLCFFYLSYWLFWWFQLFVSALIMRHYLRLFPVAIIYSEVILILHYIA